MKRIDPKDIEGSYRRALASATPAEINLAIHFHVIGNPDSLNTPIGMRRPGEPAMLYLEMALSLSRDGELARIANAVCDLLREKGVRSLCLGAGAILAIPASPNRIAALLDAQLRFERAWAMAFGQTLDGIPASDG